MRNWNLYLLLLQRISSSFYSTYEELKHRLKNACTFHRFEFLQYLWGMNATINVFHLHLHRFYSTYEELKREFRRIIEYKCKVLQYLWGIETLISERDFVHISMVFTVPMRIETSPHISPLFSADLFYSTYENWNYFIKTEYTQHSRFTVPMRNWNILTRQVNVLVKMRFYSTYEELKLN